MVEKKYSDEWRRRVKAKWHSFQRRRAMKRFQKQIFKPNPLYEWLVSLDRKRHG